MAWDPTQAGYLADTERLQVFLESDLWRTQSLRATPPVEYTTQNFPCLRLSLLVLDGDVVGPGSLIDILLTSPALASRRLGYLSCPSNQPASASTPVSSVTWPLTQLRIRDLEAAYPKRHRTATIGVIDSGVTDSHSALAAGAVSLSRAMSFIVRGGEVTSVAPSRLTDRNGHGTAVCGVIAGREVGNYRGVAPDALITFAAICGSTTHDVQLVAAFNWLCEQNVRIINVSFGFGGPRPAHELILSRVREKSIPVCAVGNNSASSPGSTREAFSVGAADESGNTWAESAQNMSPLGLLAPDIMAPGVDVSLPLAGTTDAYRETSATSYAAPHIAGLFAALYERCKCEPSVIQIEQAILESAGPRKSANDPLEVPDALEAMKVLERLCG